MQGYGIKPSSDGLDSFGCVGCSTKLILGNNALVYDTVADKRDGPTTPTNLISALILTKRSALIGVLNSWSIGRVSHCVLPRVGCTIRNTQLATS